MSAPPRTLAVVGTDTGVGKTVIAAGLIHALRRRRLRVCGFKPVETGLGCPAPAPLGAAHPDDPLPRHTAAGATADWVQLARASGQPAASALGTAYALPASPLAAALHAGRPVDWSALEARLEALRRRADLLVLEGAGGLLVPVGPGCLWADVLQRWRCEALVVSRLGLGTINHTLLTVEALQRRGIPLHGAVLNAVEAPGPEAEATVDQIVSFVTFRVFAALPHGTTSLETVAAHLEQIGLVDRVLSGP